MKLDRIANIYLTEDTYDEYLRKIKLEKKASYLIIACNLSVSIEVIKRFLIDVADLYKKVLYVPGNIEMYLTESDKVEFKMNSFKKINYLKDICNEFENIYFLDGFDNQKVQLEEDSEIYNVVGIMMFWDKTAFPQLFETQKRKQHLRHNREIVSTYKKMRLDYTFMKFGYDSETGRINHINPNKFFKNFDKRLKKYIGDDSIDIVISVYSPIQLNIKKWDNCFKSFHGKEYLDNLNPKVWFTGVDMDIENKAAYNTVNYKNTNIINGSNAGKNIIQTIEIKEK
jgi:hypothetical protein